MIKTVKEIIHQLSLKPKTLFLIDSVGALLTTFFLFVVLRNSNEYIGMPITVLTYLSVIAACLCIYSTVCFFYLKGKWTPYIRGISVANLLYCVLTMGLLIVYYPQLKIAGIAYFVLEIVIIFGLVCIELSIAAAIEKQQQ